MNVIKMCSIEGCKNQVWPPIDPDICAKHENEMVIQQQMANEEGKND